MRRCDRTAGCHRTVMLWLDVGGDEAAEIGKLAPQLTGSAFHTWSSAADITWLKRNDLAIINYIVFSNSPIEGVQRLYFGPVHSIPVQPVRDANFRTLLRLSGRPRVRSDPPISRLSSRRTRTV